MTRIALSDGYADLERALVVRGGQTIRLSTTEARLLEHLAQHPDRAWSRDELQIEVWGYRPGISSRTVFTTVGRLRGKLEPDPKEPVHIVTETGEGYRFAPAAGDVTPARATPTLPTPATPFVGRALELSRCAEALDGGCQILTLLGPGGVGKTRIALKAAGAAADQFADGAAFVALDAVPGVDGLPAAIAAGCDLGLTSGDFGGPAGRGPQPVIDALSTREMLVVLDNFEHLAEGGAELVDTLAAACPRLTLLVTSRVRLALRRETAIEIEAMTLPASAEQLESTDGGQLLLDSARRARPGWVPSDLERATLQRICHLVGGSPLALELASAWLRLLEPEEIAQELATSLDILQTRMRDVPERHRSVRGTLEASWRLLAPEAARALSALSVFRGPFDRKSAKHVAGTNLLVLGQLVDSSMVGRRGGRFALHPLVRQLAEEKLRDVDGSVARRRHGELFLGRLEDAFLRFDRSDIMTLEFRQLVDESADEVIAAYHWALETDRDELLYRCIEPLRRALDTGNHYGALAALLDATRVRLEARPPSPARDRALGLALAFLPGIGLGDATCASRAIELLEPFGGDALCWALIHAGIGGLLVGRAAESVPVVERAVALAREGGRAWPLGFSLSVLGVLRTVQGDHEAARQHLEEAVEVGGHNLMLLRARPTVHLGELELKVGDLPAARAHLEAGLSLCREGRDHAFAVLALCRLAETCAREGGDPRELLREAVEEALAHRITGAWFGIAAVQWARLLLDDRDHAALGIALLSCVAQRPNTMFESRTLAADGLERARRELPADLVAAASAEGAGSDLEQLAARLLVL